MGTRPTQGSCSRDASILSVPRRYKWNGFWCRIRTGATPALTNFFHKGSEHQRHSSAHDHDIRFQQINYVSEPVGHHVQSLCHHLPRRGVASLVGFANNVTGQSVLITIGHFFHERVRERGKFLPGAPRDSWTSRKGFNAAALSAIAPRSVNIDSNVPSLARSSCLSVVDLSIEYDSRPDPRADCRVKYISIAPTSAPDGLSQSSGIRIIVNHRLHFETPTDFLRKRVVLPDRKIRRIDNYAGQGIQRAGSADTNGLDCRPPAKLCVQGFHRLGDRHQALFGIPGTDHGSPTLRENFARRRDESCGNFRPTDVHSNGHFCLRIHFEPSFSEESATSHDAKFFKSGPNYTKCDSRLQR